MIPTILPFKNHFKVLLGTLFLILGSTVHANPLGQIPQIPQIPAFLPMAASVPMTAKTPIDGEWVVNTIGKRIRIEAGRAYAVDPWLHLFVLKIEPGMVVIKNIQRAGNGLYTAEDLPLMGKFTAQMDAQGVLNVKVAGALGPVGYKLQPVRLDNQAAFEQERNIVSGRLGSPMPVQPLPTPVQPMPAPVQPMPAPVQPLPAPTPVVPPADCKPIGIDPDTGATICA